MDDPGAVIMRASDAWKKGREDARANVVDPDCEKDVSYLDGWIDGALEVLIAEAGGCSAPNA